VSPEDRALLRSTTQSPETPLPHWCGFGSTRINTSGIQMVRETQIVSERVRWQSWWSLTPPTFNCWDLVPMPCRADLLNAARSQDQRVFAVYVHYEGKTGRCPVTTPSLVGISHSPMRPQPVMLHQTDQWIRIGATSGSAYNMLSRRHVSCSSSLLSGLETWVTLVVATCGPGLLWDDIHTVNNHFNQDMNALRADVEYLWSQKDRVTKEK